MTNGASSDLQQVRSIARRMVAQWGFTADDVDIGLVGWEAPDAGRFSPRTASEDTEWEIDRQVKALVDVAYETTVKALTTHRRLMDTLVEHLVVKETIDGRELLGILEQYDPKLYAELGKTPPPFDDPLATEIVPSAGA